MKTRHLLFTACVLSPVPLFGNGFYIPVQAPEATGRGNAWLATADTASAVYYNAAGLTQLGSPDLVVGAYTVRLGIEADTATGNFDNDASWSLLPQIYGAVPVNEKLVAGFGINTPFGLSTDWGSASASPLGFFANETELDYVTGWFVAGYEITDEWSVGGGFGVHYADARFTKSATPPPTFTRFEGDSEALSWTLSTRWQPHEQHAFGAVFRSKTDFNLKGDADAALPGARPGENASLDLITPATIGAGYAYRPCKEWSFEANIEWVNWEELNTLTVTKASGNVPIAFNWDSNFIYSLGGTRHFDNGWSVSAGYNFIENSMPDETFNPGVSDADRHWLNIGVSRAWENFTVNFAYQFAFSDRDVSGSWPGLPPGINTDGEYKSRFHGLMLNCDWRF